jgi:hypothetical protein
MRWQPNNLDRVIGGEERHREVLLSVAPLPTTFVGNQGMLPLIACGRRRSKIW